jgi:exonuclease VII large subunit
VTEDLRCREQNRLLASSAKRTLREERKSLKLDSVGLSRGPAKLLRLEKLRFRNRSQGLGHGWARWRDARSQALRESLGKLRDGTRRLAASAERDQAEAARRLGEKAIGDLVRATAALAPLRRLLRGAWTQGSRSTAEGLALKERLVHAADPARMLDLGFSILRRADGKVIRGMGEVKAGDKVVNVLKDGTVESTVTDRKEKG